MCAPRFSKNNLVMEICFKVLETHQHVYEPCSTVFYCNESTIIIIPMWLHAKENTVNGIVINFCQCITLNAAHCTFKKHVAKMRKKRQFQRYFLTFSCMHRDFTKMLVMETCYKVIEIPCSHVHELCLSVDISTPTPRACS